MPDKASVAEAGRILRLAGPLMANNLALAGMGFTDTVMAGRLGALDLGAVAVGNSLWMLALLFGLGVLMALSPITAHAFGAGRERDVGHYWRQAMWLAQALAIVLFLFLGQARHLLEWAGVAPEMIPRTVGYVDAIRWGIFGQLAFLTLRFLTEGVGWTRPVMYIALIALTVNVAGNYALMFGKWGFPAMGAVGCGAATAVTVWVMLVAMAVYVRLVRWPFYARFDLLARFELPSKAALKELLGLGLPISMSVTLEIGLFTTAAVLMGRFGTAAAGAHQIALNYAATMFMIPLALHSATTVRVGHSLGAGAHAHARMAGFTGILMCCGVMLVSAVCMLSFRDAIIDFYTADAAVHEVASGLLFMAALFQVSDGMQVGAAGALRGYKDTRVPMVLNLIAYWGVGFPLAYGLGVHAGKGPQAVWLGLAAGLTVCAALLTARYVVISRASRGYNVGPGTRNAPT